MKLARLLCRCAIVFAFSNFLFTQTSPDLENGFKNYGSYNGSDIDTVNLLNGNLMVHIPMPWTYPQRGGAINPKNLLTMSSKTWQIKCVPMDPEPAACFWTSGSFRDQMVSLAGSGLGFDHTMDLSLHRAWSMNTDFQGNATYFSGDYSLFTADGASHALAARPNAPFDPNGDPMTYDSNDTSGFHVDLSSPDPTDGTPTVAVVTDRHGNIYQGGWSTSLPCRATRVSNGGLGEDLTSTKQCSQATRLGSITDVNGNVFTNSLDTMGRPFHAYTFVSSGADTNGCVLNGLTFSSSTIVSYAGPNGATNQVKMCYATVNIATAFGVSGVNEAQNATNFGSPATAQVLVTLILPDNNNAISVSSPKWVFNYDSYVNLTYIGLPTGGSISYTWQTLNLATPCDKISRAVASRTLDDNMGHSYKWSYHWGIPAVGTQANTVTGPLLNDTVHTFTDLTGHNSCPKYETKTQQFQGSGGPRQLLQQVDTSYSGIGEVNVVPTSIQTTLFPSNRVNLISKSYDLGLGPNQPIFGNVVSEKEYDWGQGAPGSLLRETDTTYQWQKDSRYLTAHLLDLPASVIVKDGGGNRVAETDYTYDEPAYLTGYEATVGALPTGTHITAPNPVRGNLTTLGRWLNTTNSFIASHTNWYDTGEAHQATDPLNHATTHSYDPAYAGAYLTKTCSPSTAGVTHCVSGAYDFQTGALSNLADENGQTSNYSYDSLGRLTLAKAPPDPANSNVSAQTSLTFSPANTFPLSVQRAKSITTSLSDSATNFFDGLGRIYQDQHVLPNGTAKVDTTYDALSRSSSVSNPYFTASDTTYGITQTLYDALGRAYQTTKQDGSVSTVAYSVPTTIAVNGDCVQTTDEAGKQRGACSDALGRLVEVDEPSSTPVQVNYLATLQTDGNFVLENAAGTGVWSTGTFGTNATSIYMQDDGNLVLYIFKWQAGVYAAPSPGPFPAASCSIGSYLMVNQRLNANQCITSPHGQYLLYMAPDGNFYIYDLAHNTGTWGPGTYGHPGAYAMLQSDGNFVVYDAKGAGIWSSGTYGTNADRLNMEDDGRIIIYKSAWNSGTSDGQFYGTAVAHPGCDIGIGTGWTGVLGSGQCFVSPNGRFELLMQPDGNLVIYDRSVTPNAALWSTGTAISPVDPGFAMRTLYSYDALGNLLRVDQKGTAPNDSSQWRTRTFTYDSLSRILTANNPESGLITYSYDADGNLLQKTSPAPNQTGTATQVVSYCYDELHRVIAKGYGAQTCPLATPVVTYAYDSGTNAKGHLTSLTDQAGTATYAYDILGRLAAETRTIASISKNTSYGYNLDGSLKTLTYPSGRVVTYTPDSAGRVISAVDGNGTQYVSSATYYASGAEYQRFMPGIYFRTDFNPRLQVSGFYSDNGQVTSFFINKTYSYGPLHQNNGNVISITNNKDSNRTQTFTYDALNRISSGWSAANTGAYSWGENYSIDAWGNLQISPMGGKAHGGTFQLSGNAQNRPTGLAYDAAGNLMSYLSSTYTYDQENRLSSTAGMSYTYDANGERVLKSNTSTGAAVKRYWSMGGNTLAEGNGTGNLTAEYIYFGGKRIARIDLPANTVHYYLSDHLGSTSVIVSAAGAVEEESDYYPFGTEVNVTGPGVNELKFTGKRRDTESQLDYFGARYYQNVLGRFTSADPITVVKSRMIDPQQFNLYEYVRNNPLRFTDSTGMKIDESELSDKDKKKFEHVRDIANQTGKDGKLLHPVLHDVIAKMDADSRTFVIENSKLDNGTAGMFTITDFTADGKDFTKATVQMDFKQINGLSGPFAADLVTGFNKYQGLFNVKDENGLRLAETFGHEGGGHGIFAINNPAQAVAIQKAVNETVDAVSGAKFPYPPDVMHKIATSDKALVPTESYAQQVEQKINKELQPKK